VSDDNPKSKIDNPQSFDPALAAHLAELAELAREIGAADVTIIRGAVAAFTTLVFNTPERRVLFPGPVKTIDLADDDSPAGVLVVLRFPVSDGGEAGVEIK
jgi:NAD(P)H-dependent FMN reductase